MPTQVLLTDGPFRYCRNPMTLGTILAYLGMAVAVGTKAGTVLVLSLAASLLVYLKRLEEGELAERFGEPTWPTSGRRPSSSRGSRHGGDRDWCRSGGGDRDLQPAEAVATSKRPP